MNEKHHSNAILMEEFLKKEFEAERYDFGGIIDSDFIDRNCNFGYCIPIALAKYYHSDKKTKIDDFINKYKNFSNMDLKNISQEKFELIMKELSQLIQKLN